MSRCLLLRYCAMSDGIPRTRSYSYSSSSSSSSPSSSSSSSSVRNSRNSRKYCASFRLDALLLYVLLFYSTATQRIIPTWISAFSIPSDHFGHSPYRSFQQHSTTHHHPSSVDQLSFRSPPPLFTRIFQQQLPPLFVQRDRWNSNEDDYKDEENATVDSYYYYQEKYRNDDLGLYSNEEDVAVVVPILTSPTPTLDTTESDTSTTTSRQRRSPPPTLQLDEEEEEEDYVEYDDDNVNGDYSDNEYDEYDNDIQNDSVYTEPGNFWMNPVPWKKGATNSMSAVENENNRRRRRTSSRPSMTKTSFPSGRNPKPPSPMVDLYNRLFWFGLEPLEDTSSSNGSGGTDKYNDRNNYAYDSDSDKRTMFGGTKGKFNGLSFLYDSVGVVPPEQQRPYRQSRRQRESFEYDNANNDNNNNNDDDDYDDDKELSNDRYRPPVQPQQRQQPSRSVPVTPPYDPPRVPTFSRTTATTTTINNYDDDVDGNDSTNQPSSSSSSSPPVDINRNTEDDFDDMYNDRGGAGSRRRRRSRSTQSTPPNRGGESSSSSRDWVTHTVASWFNEDNRDTTTVMDRTRSSSTTTVDGTSRREQRRRRRQRNDSSSSMNSDNNIWDTYSQPLDGRTGYMEDESNNDNVIIPLFQSLTNTLETFLGLDREVQGQRAEEYNKRMGLGWNEKDTNSQQRRRRSTTATTITRDDRQSNNRQPGPRQQRRPGVDRLSSNISKQPERSSSNYVKTPLDEMDEDVLVNHVLDTEPLPLSALDDDVDDEVENNMDTYQDRKTLSWEERAMAMDRVPPVGMVAWGPEGAVYDIDARTKAWHDAMVDVQSIHDQLQMYEQQIVDIRDAMSILQIDIALEKTQLSQQRQEKEEERSDLGRQRRRQGRTTHSFQRSVEHIRTMEYEFENMSRKLRYIQIQKDRTERERMDLNRRHWAIFHSMKHIVSENTLSKQMEDIIREFNEAEPAVRRYSDKKKLQQNEEEDTVSSDFTK
jgi:hypothetical protein